MADNNNNQKQQLKEITERLEQGVKDLFSSEKYMEYLRVMSQFHNYSFSNTLLIAMQKPEATLVAGYGAWQKKFERNVMKGEKAIKIFAPAPRKVEVERDMIDPNTKLPIIDENGEVQKEKVTIQQPHFKITSVFDVSQTDGKPLLELDTVHDLTADVEGYSIFFEALKRTSKVPMDFEPIEGGSHGFYHQVEKRIAIAEGMSEAQNVKTGIHEIAHSRLHDRDVIDAENGIMVDRRTREVQAESVAYTVCQHYGIETADYSFGYIAGWSEGKELKELRSSMEVIRREADSMITEIDKHIEDIRREREQEVEVVAEVFIASYYVVEDFDVEGAPTYHKFDDLDSALQAYFAFPNDKAKALGIENTNGQKVDMLECINGIDHTVYYHMKVEGWNIPEVTDVADRAFAVIQSHDTAVAYQNDNGFVAIQTTDQGYDYTFYNDQFEVLDGGVLDDPDLTVREAIDSILEDEGQSFTDCTVVGYDWLMEKAEAAEMGLIEQIGSKMQEPKVSMEDKQINDYKFFCFGGVAKCVKIDFDRFIEHHANYYDIKGNLLNMGKEACPPVFDKDIHLPKTFECMTMLAKKISKEIPFLRADFYDVDGKIYFGEMTFFPSSGLGRFIFKENDIELGKWLKLPEKIGGGYLIAVDDLIILFTPKTKAFGLKDYKVLCFNGKARLIEVHRDRYGNNHTQDFYDENLNLTEFQNVGDKNSHISIENKKIVYQMLKLSEKLAETIPHIRVDWYYTNSQIYFGELTFFDAGGFAPFVGNQDLIIGKMLNLDNIKQ